MAAEYKLTPPPSMPEALHMKTTRFGSAQKIKESHNVVLRLMAKKDTLFTPILQKYAEQIKNAEDIEDRHMRFHKQQSIMEKIKRACGPRNLHVELARMPYTNQAEYKDYVNIEAGDDTPVKALALMLEDLVQLMLDAFGMIPEWEAVLPAYHATNWREIIESVVAVYDLGSEQVIINCKDSLESGNLNSINEVVPIDAVLTLSNVQGFTARLHQVLAWSLAAAQDPGPEGTYPFWDRRFQFETSQTGIILPTEIHDKTGMVQRLRECKQAYTFASILINHITVQTRETRRNHKGQEMRAESTLAVKHATKDMSSSASSSSQDSHAREAPKRARITPYGSKIEGGVLSSKSGDYICCSKCKEKGRAEFNHYKFCPTCPDFIEDFKSKKTSRRDDRGNGRHDGKRAKRPCRDGADCADEGCRFGHPPRTANVQQESTSLTSSSIKSMIVSALQDELGCKCGQGGYHPSNGCPHWNALQTSIASSKQHP